MTWICQPYDKDADYAMFGGGFTTTHGDILGKWFRDHAAQDHNNNFTRVWVMCDPERPGEVIGFFTLSAGTLANSAHMRKIVPRPREKYPVSTLGKFAVDQHWVGTEASHVLMGYVFAAHRTVADNSGAAFLTLECVHDKPEAFYEKFGFKLVSSVASDGRRTMAISTQRVRATVAQ